MARDEAYRQAEKKIEEARRSGAKELHLIRMKLTEVPDSLGQLAQLQTLDLSRNQLTALPESLGQLTQLETLDLPNNQLTALPESLGQLTQLQTLNLGSNGLAALPEWIGQLTQLQTLDLSNNQLTALPESLGQLTQLETLDLPNNQLTSLPESLSQLTQLQTLNLGSNQLAALPEWLVQLTQLQTLDLSGNQLTALPEWIGQLTQLQTLYLYSNQLTALPEPLGQLTQLQELDLSQNRLATLPSTFSDLAQLRELSLAVNLFTSLPTSVGTLEQLQTLALFRNHLTALPDFMSKLKSLRKLFLGTSAELGHIHYRAWPCKTKLTFLPNWVGQLNRLEVLGLEGNELTDLPLTLCDLGDLRDLRLNDNPLNPELAAAYAQGLDAIKAYLRERSKGTRQRYEAKLLILGDGNEGKTCISRALRGLPFEKQPTTRGVDVEPWTFPHPDHPDDEKREITLNLWDFEGQEINHQTHQFFLSTEALYLLVFKCRDQFLLERAEYWLDTIRSRAPGAQVAIVITECEQRTPYVPQDRLLAEYSDLLIGDHWLFAVGCEDKSGVLKLQEELHRRAANLEFMGRDWPQTYDKAETLIEEQAKTTSHVTRGELHQIFVDSQIDKAGYGEAARSLARLGVITQFPDCPDLTDFIVLQPQWLTKAISHVMENKQLDADQGEIKFVVMQQIWAEHGQDSMFPTFHDCMKEFELCYDLENHNDYCLVPLRFGYLKPDIPWATGANMKTRRVTYRLNLRPPMGLMSRFIVKTHHMIVRPTEIDSSSNPRRGVYWHNGVFLESGEGPLLSQALCEFDVETRTLGIEVRAAFPQKMLGQLDGFVDAVFDFFQGLKPVRSYGCIRFDEDSQAETQCGAVHSERKILFALQNEELLPCEDGWHKVDPMRLITGIGSFGGDIQAVIREEAERTRERLEETPRWASPFIHNIGVLLDWADRHQQTLQQLQDDHANLAPEIRQELELKLREYLGHMSDMLDERQDKSAPALFSIGNQDGSSWNPKTLFKTTWVLTPWCEFEGAMHRHVPGQLRIPIDRNWWKNSKPWIACGTKVLATGLQLAFAGMPLALGNDVYNVVKSEVTFMKELTKHLELTEPSDEDDVFGFFTPHTPETGREHIKDLRGTETRIAIMRAALSRFLEALAPDNYRAGQWGELKRTRLPDNTYRWLCKQHAQESRK